MIFRKALQWATFLLPVFLVIFAVLLGAAWLAGSVGDGLAGRWLAGLAVVSGLAFVADLILLVWMLGLTAVLMMERRQHGRHKWMKHRRRRRMMRHHEEEHEVDHKPHHRRGGKKKRGRKGKRRTERAESND